MTISKYLLISSKFTFFGMAWSHHQVLTVLHVFPNKSSKRCWVPRHSGRCDVVFAQWCGHSMPTTIWCWSFHPEPAMNVWLISHVGPVTLELAMKRWGSFSEFFVLFGSPKITKREFLCLIFFQSRGIRRYFVTVKSTDALYAATARMFDRSLAAIEHCRGTAERLSLIPQLPALCLPKPHRITQTCRSSLRIFWLWGCFLSASNQWEDDESLRQLLLIIFP